MKADEPVPPDYYARLDVRPTASAEEIRDAYREKAWKTHPDRNDDPEAGEQFRDVQEAYRILSDPERREAYDRARAGGRAPEVLHITRDAPAGCGGYLWRVFAGGAAAIAFFALEAAGVWSAGGWTIALAIGGAALVAGLASVLVADRFPDEATDVSLRFDEEGLVLWADGRLALRCAWRDVRAVRLRDDGWGLEIVVKPSVAEGLRPVRPVLTGVERRRGRGVLRLDLSETDVSRTVLGSYLEGRDAIPYTPAGKRPSTFTGRSDAKRAGG